MERVAVGAEGRESGADHDGNQLPVDSVPKEGWADLPPADESRPVSTEDGVFTCIALAHPQPSIIAYRQGCASVDLPSTQTILVVVQHVGLFGQGESAAAVWRVHDTCKTFLGLLGKQLPG